MIGVPICFENRRVVHQSDEEQHQADIDGGEDDSIGGRFHRGHTCHRREEGIGHHSDEHGVVEGDQDSDRAVLGFGIEFTGRDQLDDVDEQANPDHQAQDRGPTEVVGAIAPPGARA